MDYPVTALDALAAAPAIAPPDAALAVAPLAAALANEYLDVRLSAAEALARRGPTARPALPALRQAAEAPNELLRNTARHAIRRIE